MGWWGPLETNKQTQKEKEKTWRNLQFHSVLQCRQVATMMHARLSATSILLTSISIFLRISFHNRSTHSLLLLHFASKQEKDMDKADQKRKTNLCGWSKERKKINK
jgi:hypothetical protein